MNERKTARRQKGVMAVLAAVTIPVLLLFLALAIEVSYLMLVRTKLQAAADSVALACVVLDRNDRSECRLPPASRPNIDLIRSAQALPGLSSIDIRYPISAAECPDRDKCAYVTSSTQFPSFLLGIFGSGTGQATLSSDAKAGSASRRACVLALEDDPAKRPHININGRGTAGLYGPDCVFHSNHQITTEGRFEIEAKDLTCVNNTAPSALNAGNLADCTKVGYISDPYAGLAKPSLPATAGACTRNQPVLGQCTCTPGRYDEPNFACGSATLINLDPGLYYLQRNFSIGATPVVGDGITFFLKGKRESDLLDFRIAANGSHRLTAPTRRQYTEGTAKYINADSVGMLIWNDTASTKNKLTGSHDSSLLGTIYLPKGMLEVSGSAQVSIDEIDQCNTPVSGVTRRCTEYGSLVAKAFDFVGNSIVAFNSAYDGSRPMTNSVRLLR